MAARIPLVRQISWLGTALTLLMLGLAIALGVYCAPENGVLWGAAAFVVYSIGSKRILGRHHRAGIAMVKRRQFREAIALFQQGLEFFDRHPWLDRFRSVVMLSASAMCYREMALTNIAFCYAQLGDGKRAREWYDACLARFPENGIAIASLRTMNAAVAAKD